MSYRFTFVVLTICYLLNGCRVTPLHKWNDEEVVESEGYVSQKGYPLKIATIPNREGISLRNRLLEIFQDNPIYFSTPHRLEAQLNIQNKEFVKYPDGSVGRYEITCTVDYSIFSLNTGKIALKSKVYSTVTYNTASSQGTFEFSIYTPYYDSMFRQLAHEIAESVRFYSRNHHENKHSKLQNR